MLAPLALRSQGKRARGIKGYEILAETHTRRPTRP